MPQGAKVEKYSDRLKPLLILRFSLILVGFVKIRNYPGSSPSRITQIS
jgi:hypothetical protein